MYQDFTSRTSPQDGPPRLAALRAELATAGLDGFLVPRADIHQGEYVAPRDERLAWLTGFTGSAGFCAVLADIAGVFIDGRYREQVKTQVDLAHFTPVHWPETKLADWLAEALPEGGTIGFDPRLHSVKEIGQLKDKGEADGLTYQPADNLIDVIWPDQPEAPLGAVAIHSLDLAGEDHAEKRTRLGDALRAESEDTAVITLPDSIAWLLNIRGSDIPRNPIPHGFAVLSADGHVDLFIAPEKLSDEIRTHLGNDVTCHPVERFGPHLEGLKGRVRLDKASAPWWVQEQLGDAEVVLDEDPCILPKARKNAHEIEGMRVAHLRDAAAVVRFLTWLDAEAPKGTLTEIDVVKALEGFRRADPMLRDISFDTIAGSGPNGAIVHYRVTEETNRTITPGDLLLVDSGGQYLDGTTDITRTIHTGKPPKRAREAFTRVLQGMIAMSQARWPKGVTGRDLDVLARMPLWQTGRDYDHGTGHGVGAYLCVHEGPQRLSRLSEVPLEPGMILSNEPGYYRAGEYGIRIENLIYVAPAPAKKHGDDREMLEFDILTWVPIDRRLIVKSLLSRNERAWIDNYHAETRRLIGPLLAGADLAWLDKATARL